MTHLFRLVANLAEAVLHGCAGQQFRATHHRQVLGYLVVNALLHVLENMGRVSENARLMACVRFYEVLLGNVGNSHQSCGFWKCLAPALSFLRV